MRIFIDKDRAPSWNQFYSGKHWSGRSNIANEKHMLVRSQIDPETEMMTPVTITLIATYKSKPVDADNIVDKVYIDGLIGWIIPDDDPDHVLAVTTISKIGDENSVEILIEEGE